MGYWLNPPGSPPIIYLQDGGGQDMRLIIRIDPRYSPHPTEVENLIVDPNMTKQKTGWLPEITARELCAEMVAHHLAEAKNMPCSSTTATKSM